jgi:hypothetical protein
MKVMTELTLEEESDLKQLRGGRAIVVRLTHKEREALNQLLDTGMYGVSLGDLAERLIANALIGLVNQGELTR